MINFVIVYKVLMRRECGVRAWVSGRPALELFRYIAGTYGFTWMRITTSSPFSYDSFMVWPLIRHHAGMSFSAPGSVQVTSTVSPSDSSAILFCVLITGIGHKLLRASNVWWLMVLNYRFRRDLYIPFLLDFRNGHGGDFYCFFIAIFSGDFNGDAFSVSALAKACSDAWGVLKIFVAQFAID